MNLTKELQGTGKVFGFTLRQLLKMKSNIVMLIIMLIVSLASVPVLSIINNKGVETEMSGFEESLKKSGLSDEEIGRLSKSVYSGTASWAEMQEAEASEDGEFNEGRYNTQLGYSIVLMMICVMSVSYIIRAVVEEKASKLVDLLLVSVKPMALLLGKVLAVLIYILIYFGIIIGGALLSSKVCGLFMDTSAAASLLSSLNLKADVLTVCIIIVSCLLGYIGFGILAGVSGAGCSNMEETSGAMSTSMLLIMAGYMFSIVIGTGMSPAKIRVFSMIPIISVFIAPMQYMYGNIGFGTVALSWGLQLIFVLLLLWLASRVYSSLIIYNGTAMKMKSILKMAFGKGEKK